MLDRYIEVAKATCEMMGTLRKLPISKDRQLAIYLQRKREEEALVDHEKAARTLLNALEVHPELPLAWPELVSPSVSRSPSARLNTKRRGLGAQQNRSGI
jgi:hypothetical protein